MPELFIAVVCMQFVTRLVAHIGTSHFVLVVGVLTMNTAGLEALALVLRGTLLVVASVVVATAVIAKLALLASTMRMMTIDVIASSVQSVALALIGKMAHLARISLLQLLAYLAPCFRSNRSKLMAFKASIFFTSLVDWLEVLFKSL
jgi:hypothetical protein